MSDRKIIGIYTGIGMNVNGIIGLGIFTTQGIIWKTLNSPHTAIILWIIGGIVSMAGSLSFAELGSSIKQNGGEIAYLSEACPKFSQLPTFVGYLFSFLFIVVILPGRISAELQAAAQLFLYTISNDPSEVSSDGLDKGWSVWRLRLIAIIMLAIITGSLMFNNKLALFISQVFAIIKSAILVTIAILGLVKLPSVLKENPNNWSNPFEGTTKGFEAFSSAFGLILFSYDGWSNFSYSLVNVAFISVVPREAIFIGDIPNKFIVGNFFKEFLGEKAKQVSSFIVMFSAIGSATSLVFSGSRVLAYAAHLKYIPFFSDQLKWDFKDETPKSALIAQFMWSSLIIILIEGGITSDFYGYCALIFYVLTGIGLLYLRYIRPNEFRINKVPNIIILFFIFGRLCGLIFPYFSVTCPDNESNCEEYMNSVMIKRQVPYFTGLGFITISAICYFISSRGQLNDDDDDDEE